MESTSCVSLPPPTPHTYSLLHFIINSTNNILFAAEGFTAKQLSCTLLESCLQHYLVFPPPPITPPHHHRGSSCACGSQLGYQSEGGKGHQGSPVKPRSDWHQSKWWVDTRSDKARRRQYAFRPLQSESQVTGEPLCKPWKYKSHNTSFDFIPLSILFINILYLTNPEASNCQPNAGTGTAHVTYCPSAPEQGLCLPNPSVHRSSSG